MSDAKKDRGEYDEDRCQDCWHAKDECICEEEPPQETEQEHMRRMLEFGLSKKP